MDAEYLLKRKGEQPVRIGRLEVALLTEGHLRQIVERADVAGLELERLPAVMMERNVVVRPAQGHLQSLELQFAQFVPAHGFILVVPDVVHDVSMLAVTPDLRCPK